MKTFCAEIEGPFALFTDPISKKGGEKSSYPVPTYSSLVGLLENVYRKPTFDIVVTRLRVMNEIQRQAMALKPLSLDGTNTLAYYSYLRDVRYQVEFKMEWSIRDDLAGDRDWGKHAAIMERSLKAGGRRNPVLGTSECQALVAPGVFGEGPGFYDLSPRTFLGSMSHGIDYPERTGCKETIPRPFWDVYMENGVVVFPHPEEIRGA